MSLTIRFRDIVLMSKIFRILSSSHESIVTEKQLRTRKWTKMTENDHKRAKDNKIQNIICRFYKYETCICCAKRNYEKFFAFVRLVESANM